MGLVHDPDAVRTRGARNFDRPGDDRGAAGGGGSGDVGGVIRTLVGGGARGLRGGVRRDLGGGVGACAARRGQGCSIGRSQRRMRGRSRGRRGGARWGSWAFLRATAGIDLSRPLICARAANSSRTERKERRLPTSTALCSAASMRAGETSRKERRAHHWPLRVARRDRRGRSGHGAPRAAPRAGGLQSDRRDQAIARAVREGPGLRSDVPGRGAPRRAHPPPQRRLDARRRRAPRRAVPGDGVRAGGVAREARAVRLGDRRVDGVAGRGRDRGGLPARPPRGARSAERTRRAAGARTPRRVPAERPGGSRRRAASRRLRGGEGGGARPDDARRAAQRQAPLHGPRTDPGAHRHAADRHLRRVDRAVGAARAEAPLFARERRGGDDGGAHR